REGLPVPVGGPSQPERAAEGVRIGQAQGGFGSVDLATRQFRGWAVEAGKQRRRLSGRELQLGTYVSRCPDADVLTAALCTQDGPLLAARHGRARQAGKWSEEVDECRQVVGAHVEERAGAGGVEERGVWVPTL